MTDIESIIFDEDAKYMALGVMCGSSLDGMDLCLTSFQRDDEGWSYELHKTDTIELPKWVKEYVSHLEGKNAHSLVIAHQKFGAWAGTVIKGFLDSHKPHVIGFHGVTLWHEPEHEISYQLGDGEAVASITGFPTVTNFRNKDIYFSGQGAPLVPFGEDRLFPEFNTFLNLGGIANLTVLGINNPYCGDVAPCNQVLNFYASKLGNEFDMNGSFAESGSFIQALYDTWKSLDYFDQSYPKSLSNQWVIKHFLDRTEDPKDVLHTFSQLLSDLVLEDLPANRKILISGGGSYNKFLIHLLRTKNPGHEFMIPEGLIVDFKEALIFGFLGLMRLYSHPNTISALTGATRDVSGGILFS